MRNLLRTSSGGDRKSRSDRRSEKLKDATDRLNLLDRHEHVYESPTPPFVDNNGAGPSGGDVVVDRDESIRYIDLGNGHFVTGPADSELHQEDDGQPAPAPVDPENNNLYAKHRINGQDYYEKTGTLEQDPPEIYRTEDGLVYKTSKKRYRFLFPVDSPLHRSDQIETYLSEQNGLVTAAATGGAHELDDLDLNVDDLEGDVNSSSLGEFSSSQQEISAQEVPVAPVYQLAKVEIASSQPTRKLHEARPVVFGPEGEQVRALLDVEHQNSVSITFTPTTIGTHTISAELADGSVFGSPLRVHVYDVARLVFAGLDQPAVRELPFMFLMDASRAGYGRLEVGVYTGNSAQPHNVPHYVHLIDDTHFKVQFTPVSARVHFVRVLFNGDPVPGSPFEVAVFKDKQEASSYREPQWIPIGQKVFMDVPAGHWPKAHLEAKVYAMSYDDSYSNPAEESIPFNVKHEGDMCTLDFTPSVVGLHRVSTMCSNVHICESPYLFQVYDSSQLGVIDAPPHLTAGHRCAVTIRTPCPGAIDSHATPMGTNRRLPVTIESIGQDDSGFTYRLLFMPQGDPLKDHLLFLSFNGTELAESPIKLAATATFHPASRSERNADDNLYGRESSYEGPIGRSVSLDVNISGLPRQSIDVHVTDPNGRPLGHSLDYQQGPAGASVCHIEFQPQLVGRYRVDIDCAGQPLDDSPFMCDVHDSTTITVHRLPASFSRCFQPIRFTVDCTRAGRADMRVEVKERDGPIVPVECRRLDVGLYEFTFEPRSPVDHLVHISFGGDEVPGSPFVVFYGGADTASESKAESPVTKSPTPAVDRITAYGPALDGNATVGETTGFFVNTHGTVGRLFIKVEGPNSTCRCKVDRIGDEILHLTFKPEELGRHNITVLCNGHPIPGSPFRVIYGQDQQDMVGGSAQSPLQQTSVTRAMHHSGLTRFARAHGEGLERACVGQKTSFFVRPDASGDLYVQIDGPTNPVKCRALQLDADTYRVEYTPTEVGLHSIMIKFNGHHIENSPFNITVSPAGQLSAHSGDVAFFNRASQSNQQLYSAASRHYERGSAVVEHSVAATSGEVTLQGHGLKALWIGELASFSIDGRNAPADGIPRVVLIQPDGREIHCQVAEVSAGVYQCQYTAERAGLHYLDVFWGETRVTGSPFEVMVRSRQGASAGSTSPVVVPASTVFLRSTRSDCLPSSAGTSSWDFRISLGQSFQAIVDVKRADQGTLNASCSGPGAKAWCEVIDQKDGTVQLTVRPRELGLHYLIVTFNEQPIQGSPFRLLVVEEAPVAEPQLNAVVSSLAATSSSGGIVRESSNMPQKLRVYGPGLAGGVLNHFDGRFYVDAMQAGHGALNVRVRGPKGAFKVSLEKVPNSPGLIECRYNPTVPGRYLIDVFWSGERLPDCPFIVPVSRPTGSLNRADAMSMRSLAPVSSATLQRLAPVSATSATMAPSRMRGWSWKRKSAGKPSKAELRVSRIVRARSANNLYVATTPDPVLTQPLWRTGSSRSLQAVPTGQAGQADTVSLAYSVNEPAPTRVRRTATLR